MPRSGGRPEGGPVVRLGAAPGTADMTVTRFLLTDTASGAWQERFALRPGDVLRLAGSESWSVRKETLRGGLSDGVDIVTLDSGTLSVNVLPTRGMGVWDAVYRGLRLGWRGPAERP